MRAVKQLLNRKDREVKNNYTKKYSSNLTVKVKNQLVYALMCQE